MKSFILTVSLFVCLTLGISNAYAQYFEYGDLPKCEGDVPYFWNNCEGYINYHNTTGLKKYFGEFGLKGKLHGRGRLYYQNGDYYEGQFSDGKKDGLGTQTYKDGRKYVGQFKDNRRNGQGILKFANGSKYVGESKENNFDGQGTHTFTDGSKWVGTFKNNYLNGFATIYNADGSIEYEGIFKDSELMFAQNKSKTDSFKIFCEDLGFKPKTEGFGNCILKLMELNKD